LRSYTEFDCFAVDSNAASIPRDNKLKYCLNKPGHTPAAIYCSPDSWQKYNLSIDIIRDHHITIEEATDLRFLNCEQAKAHLYSSSTNAETLIKQHSHCTGYCSQKNRTSSSQTHPRFNTHTDGSRL